MDLRQQANNVANQGRYGDSMLLHVNPMEMKGLASAMPLTINPQTGQPEAFLPFLAPILGSILGPTLFTTLGGALGTGALGSALTALGGKAALASAVGSGLAQTAATGDIKKGLLAGLTGYGVGQFLDKVGGLSGQIGAQEATKTALQQTGVPLTGEIGTKAIQDAGALGLQKAGETTASQIFQAPKSTEIGDILGGLQKTDGSALFSKDLGANVFLEDVVPSGLEVGTKATLEALSDPSVYIPAGIGMGTTGQIIDQEKFERYMANAPEREKERIRQIMAMYPEAIPMQEGGFLNDPLIYEAGKALSLDEINKRLRRQMTPAERAAYERFYNIYMAGTPGGMESMPGGGSGGGDGNDNQGNYQFDGGDDDPIIRRANPIPQGFIGGFAPEFSYFNNVNPSATDLEQGTSSQAGLGGQRRFMPQTGSGLQLANRDLSANVYADAFANAIPDLTSEQRQQARDYAFQVETTNDFDPNTETLPMPEFLRNKDFLKGFEAGNKVRSQVQANPNQFGIATPGQFSPTQTAGYRQFYGSSAIGVPQVIDPNAPTQGFSVSPFTPSALPPPIAPPPSTGTDPNRGNTGGGDTEGNGGQKEDTETETGAGETGPGEGDQKEETEGAGTETRFLPDLTREQFDLMLQGQKEYADIKRRFEDILGIPLEEPPTDDTETETGSGEEEPPVEETPTEETPTEEFPTEEPPVEETPVIDTPDYAQQLADQAELIRQLQEQIASNQEAISGIPQFDPTTIDFSDIQGVPDFATTDQLFDPSTLDLSGFATTDDLTGFATTDDLSTAFSNVPQFDPSTIDFSDFDFSNVFDFDPSDYVTSEDLSTAISGVPQFDPSTLDFSDYVTSEDLSTAISGVPQFDPSTLDFSDYVTTEDLSTAIGNVPQFDPETIDFSNVDFSGVDFGFPDLSDYVTTEDLSTAISGVPQFDPSTLDFSDFATQEDLSTAISGVPQFDPSTLSLPDFTQYATTDQLFDPSTLSLPDFTQYATTDQLFDPSTLNLPDFSQYATTDQLFDPSTLNLPDFSQYATTDQLFDPSTLDFSNFATTDQLFDPSTLNLPDFTQYATSDQLFDPSTLDFSGFATTDQLFDPSTLQTQIDDLQSLLDQQGGTLQSESNPAVSPTVIGPLVGSKGNGDSIGKSDGGSLKTVPEDNKGLSKLPEDVRNKMGYMNEGGLTESMLADPLTNQVAQFILGNETNDEVISAFIEKYGPTSFRELRRAVLKTLAPNAQTEGMIKGSLAGGMKDDIFGVIGDPEKNGQRVAVSQDEFIVPADVVSMLGDGSSDAGANKLYNMMKRIREEKTNTTKQARPINDNKVMPA